MRFGHFLEPPPDEGSSCLILQSYVGIRKPWFPLGDTSPIYIGQAASPEELLTHVVQWKRDAVRDLGHYLAIPTELGKCHLIQSRLFKDTLGQWRILHGMGAYNPTKYPTMIGTLTVSHKGEGELVGSRQFIHFGAGADCVTMLLIPGGDSLVTTRQSVDGAVLETLKSAEKWNEIAHNYISLGRPLEDVVGALEKAAEHSQRAESKYYYLLDISARYRIAGNDHAAEDYLVKALRVLGGPLLSLQFVGGGSLQTGDPGNLKFKFENVSDRKAWSVDLSVHHPLFANTPSREPKYPFDLVAGESRSLIFGNIRISDLKQDAILELTLEWKYKREAYGKPFVFKSLIPVNVRGTPLPTQSIRNYYFGDNVNVTSQRPPLGSTPLKCQYCGADYYAGDRHCTNCGKPVS